MAVTLTAAFFALILQMETSAFFFIIRKFSAFVNAVLEIFLRENSLHFLLEKKS